MSILRQIAQLGHPILRQVAEPVTTVAAPSVQSLIDDMLATVADVNGVGLAAPQVYESLRIFIIASRPNARYPRAPEMDPFAVVNPEIVLRSEETVKDWEGCLSIPGIRGLVPRSRAIRSRYMTRDGLIREEEFSDFVARIFQHELDHLDGTVFLDRLESSRDMVTEKEYIRLMLS